MDKASEGADPQQVDHQAGDADAAVAGEPAAEQIAAEQILNTCPPPSNTTRHIPGVLLFLSNAAYKFVSSGSLRHT